VAINEYGAPFVGMISDEQFDEPSLSEYTTADPTSACADHLTFDEATRSFICRRYAQPCEVDRDLNFGLLSSVKCTMCNVTFHRHRIPRQWRLSRLWTADPTILPLEQQTSYEPPPPAFSSTPTADTQHARISATTDMNSDIPDHEVTCAHLYNNSSILNPPERLLPINQTALTMLLDDVLNHGTSELESRFEALLVGLAEERKQIFRARLMNRKRLHASRNITETSRQHFRTSAESCAPARLRLKRTHIAASNELFRARTSRRERCPGCPSRSPADSSR
jgi:hypothetical protein